MAVTNEQHNNGVDHRLPSQAAMDSFGLRLRQARLSKGWSQHRLIHGMREAAQRLFGHQLPSDRSLKAMVSRWENNWRVPDQYNRQVLAAALDISVQDLNARAAGDEAASMQPPPP